jgi:uncharacterized damage-inducible protein DinB
MTQDDLVDQLLTTWRRHQEVLMLLLDAVPRGGLPSLPKGSRGRDVSRQFFHLDRVRRGWLHYHETGQRPKLERAVGGKAPTKVELRKLLKASGKEVDAFLARAFAGEAKVRMFGKSPVRWMTYLIAHESHHRGQIALALKQSGKRLDEDVAVQGLWGRWMAAE